MKSGKLLIAFLNLLYFVSLSFVCLQYALSSQYKFPDPVPFSGDSLYNPYTNNGGKWMKSNFHAHSVCWGGIVNGHQEADSIVTHYKRDMGYDVACISNYELHTRSSMMWDSRYFPIYEHGYNIHKAHHLVIGGDDVCLRDMVFAQSLHNKQYMIDHVKEHAPVVALLHPDIRDGFRKDELEKLSGYELIEVLNHHRNAEPKWDIVLSSGKPVWIIANDDCHDISLENETGVSWTMVKSSHTEGDSIIRALASGNSYGATGKMGINEHYLEQVEVNGHSVNYTLDSEADEIIFIGQNGMVKGVVKNAGFASYSFTPDDTYIRVVVKFPSLTLYLNPVIRYNGISAPVNASVAIEDLWQTLLMRLFIFVIWMSGIFLMFRWNGWDRSINIRVGRFPRSLQPEAGDVGMA